MKLFFTVLLFAVAFNACTKDEEAERHESDTQDLSAIETLAARGQEIYRDKAFGEEAVACSDCHADFDEAQVTDDLIRPGHGLTGAHRRAKTWNGEFSGDDLPAVAAGAAKCAHLYQGRGASVRDALTSDEAAALMAFYEYISTGDEPMVLPWDVLTWPGDTSMTRDERKEQIEKLEAIRGNAQRGEALFRRACASCHHQGYAPAVRMLKRNVTRNIRVGHGGMPFFSRDKLSDQDVADIRVFLEGR
jgi:mono/diheme cytochrome c family protein